MDFDTLTASDLRRRGSLKWSLFPDTLGAFVAEMDFGTAPEITAALHEAVDAAAFGYLPQALSDAMSSACADWQQQRHGWSVPASDVHPIGDVVSGLALAIEHHSRPGSPVILPVPAYMPFLTVPPTLGREIITVPMIDDHGSYRFDLAGLDAAYAAGGDLLVLCNPYNPVGRVFTDDELTEVSAVVDRHGGRVFSDEIHAPLTFPGHPHRPYASLSPITAGHTVTATSASKAWNLPGLKCAQLIISNPADAEIWAGYGTYAAHGASTLGVIANTVAYTAGEPWLSEVIAYLDGNRRTLAAALAAQPPGVGFVPPEGTYIGWLDVRALELDDPAAFFREQAGVALTDGRDCGAPGFLRMIFATPRPIIIEAVEAMGAALRRR